jgi:hypothetical protein
MALGILASLPVTAAHAAAITVTNGNGGQRLSTLGKAQGK